MTITDEARSAEHERERKADEAEWAAYCEILNRGADKLDPDWRARCCGGSDRCARDARYGCTALAGMVDHHGEMKLLEAADWKKSAPGWPALHPGKRCRGCGLGVFSLWIGEEPPTGSCQDAAEEPRRCPRALEALITSRAMSRHTGKPGAWAAAFMAKVGIDPVAVDTEIDQRAAIDTARTSIYGKVLVDGKTVQTWVGEDPMVRLPAVLSEILGFFDPTTDAAMLPPDGEGFGPEDLERIEKRTAGLRRRLHRLIDDEVVVPEMDGEPDV